MLSERVDTKAHLWLQLDRVVKVVGRGPVCAHTHSQGPTCVGSGMRAFLNRSPPYSLRQGSHCS